MMEWIAVGQAAEYAEGTQRCVRVGGKEVVVFRIGDTFHVIRNICPHAGLPLGEGERRGFVLTCPYHGYAYDVRSGRNVDWPHDEPPVKTYPARVRDGRLEIEMEATLAVSEQKRGPAPEDHPADEKTGIADAGQPLTQPEAPDGYPDEERQIPGVTEQKTDPKPKPKPTEQGN